MNPISYAPSVYVSTTKKHKGRLCITLAKSLLMFDVGNRGTCFVVVIGELLMRVVSLASNMLQPTTVVTGSIETGFQVFPVD